MLGCEGFKGVGYILGIWLGIWVWAIVRFWVYQANGALE